MGKKAMPAAISCDRVLLKSVSFRDKYFARASAVNILHNLYRLQINEPQWNPAFGSVYILSHHERGHHQQDTE